MADGPELLPRTVPTPLARAPEAVTAFVEAGTGEAVVLIHGVGMQARIWAPQIAVLSQTHRVIALDMLGHGGSSRPPRDPGLADYAGQVAALMDALGLAEACVVGHSMGALVALELALSHPTRVRRVAALNAVFRRSAAEKAAVASRVAALADGLGEAAIAGTIARWFGEPVPAAVRPAAELARQFLHCVDFEGYHATYGLFAASDEAHADRLSGLDAPALFLTGEHDRNSTPAMSKAMASLAPKGQAAVLPGQAHMMALTHPAAVNRALADFLNDQESPMSATVDPMAFRKALGAFPTGVTIVTCADEEGGARGFTANSFTSVSLDPPLVLACIAKKAFSHGAFRAAKGFAVNVLSEEQKGLSSQFASKAPDKFVGVDWSPGYAGNPLLAGATAAFDCAMHDVVDAGDHTILIGRVEAFSHETFRPLGYCRGAYVSFGLSQEALTQRGAMLVGAILETDGGILLVEDASGRLDLPSAPLLEPESDPSSLASTLAQLGYSADLGFLFSVFDSMRDGAAATEVYYRGLATAAGPLSPQTRILPLDALDAAPLSTPAVRLMLGRYARERQEDCFGVYVGNEVAGTVRTVPLGAGAKAEAVS